MADNIVTIFIQAFMAKPLMKEEETNELFQKICEQALAPGVRAPGSAADLAQQHANVRLERVGLALRRCVADDGVAYWGLVNQSSDEQAKKALVQAVGAAELALFRQLLELLAKRAPTAFLGHAEASGLAAKAAKTTAAGDALLARLVAGQWLARNERDELVCGPRAQLELRAHLTDLEAPDCPLCHEPVLRGTACPHKPCQAVVHFHCARTYFAGREAKCLLCTRPWPMQ